MDANTGAEERKLLFPYEKIGVNNTFRTSLAGFDKQAVLYYIDNLRSDAAAQQRTFTVEIDRLYAKNVELSRSVAYYEKEVASLNSRLEKEREQNALNSEQNSLMNDVVQKLQTRYNELLAELEKQRANSSNLGRMLQAATARSDMMAEELRKANAQGHQTQQLGEQVRYLSAQAQQREQAYAQRIAQYEQAYAQRIAQYEQTIAYFKSNYENATNENKRLRFQTSNSENLARANEGLNTEVANLQQKIYALQSQLNAQSNYTRGLINQLNDMKNARNAQRPVYANPNASPQVQNRFAVAAAPLGVYR